MVRSWVAGEATGLTARAMGEGWKRVMGGRALRGRERDLGLQTKLEMRMRSPKSGAEAAASSSHVCAPSLAACAQQRARARRFDVNKVDVQCAQ
jgi:hypothetical protein